jgi:hypothetical protein
MAGLGPFPLEALSDPVISAQSEAFEAAAEVNLSPLYRRTLSLIVWAQAKQAKAGELATRANLELLDGTPKEF